MNLKQIFTYLERLAAFILHASKPAAASVSSVGAERLTSYQASGVTPHTRVFQH